MTIPQSQRCKKLLNLSNLFIEKTNGLAEISENGERNNDFSLVARIGIPENALVFSENAFIDTCRSRKNAISLPGILSPDYENLAWLYLLNENSVNSDYRLTIGELVRLLSADSLSSEVGQRADPFLVLDFQDAAKELAEIYSKDEGMQSQIFEKLFYFYGVLNTNCHAKPKHDKFESPNDQEEDDIGLFFIGSFLEHSCLPNCKVDLKFEDTKGAAMDVYCGSSLQPRDVLSISYLPQELLCYTERLPLLQKRGFDCLCALCKREKEGEIGLLTIASCPECHYPVFKNKCRNGHEFKQTFQDLQQIEHLLIDSDFGSSLASTEMETYVTNLDECISQYLELFSQIDLEVLSQVVSCSSDVFNDRIEEFSARLLESPVYQKSHFAPLYILSAASLQFIRLVIRYASPKLQIPATFLLLIGDHYLMSIINLSYSHEIENDFRLLCLLKAETGFTDLENSIKNELHSKFKKLYKLCKI